MLAGNRPPIDSLFTLTSNVIPCRGLCDWKCYAFDVVNLLEGKCKE